MYKKISGVHLLTAKKNDNVLFFKKRKQIVKTGIFSAHKEMSLQWLCISTIIQKHYCYSNIFITFWRKVGLALCLVWPINHQVTKAPETGGDLICICTERQTKRDRQENGGRKIKR